MDQQQQFDNWVDKWEMAQKKWDADGSLPKPVQNTKSSNFFGLQNNEIPETPVSQEDGNYWADVYNRSSEVATTPESSDQIFNEQAEGWRKLLTGPGQGVKFFHNPIKPSSVGMDQSNGPYNGTRVAPNFTDGKELRELNDLKIKLEKLEGALLGKEILAGKANVPVDSYKSKLDKLRQEIDDLSDKLTPEPAKDVY